METKEEGLALKRPAGKGKESPLALRERLRAQWPKFVATEIENDLEPDARASRFPLAVAIGRPVMRTDDLMGDVVGVRDWIAEWREAEKAHQVSFQEMRKRRIGEIAAPDRMTFPTIDDLARFLGGSASHELDTARRRFADLHSIDPRLAGLARGWETLAGLTAAEHEGVCEFLRARRFAPGELLSIREMLITGLDGKFLEQNRRILQEALACMDLLREGSDFRERLGFRADDRQTLWLKVHTGDMEAPFGADQFAVRPSAIERLPETVRQVTIVENIETFFGYRPRPGVCLIFGCGNAIAGMACDMPFLQELDVVYWGDLDTYGMKILSRLRRAVPGVRSVLMDEATMRAIGEERWGTEPKSDRFLGEIDGLTQEEEAALWLIRAGNHRIEQEHVRPTDDGLAALGLERRTADTATAAPGPASQDRTGAEP